MKTATNTVDLATLCSALRERLGGDVVVHGPRAGELAVAGLCADSRLVRPGDLFIATPGTHDDGRRYVQQALDRGAAGVVAAHDLPPAAGVAWVSVSDPRRAKGLLADAFHHRPSRRLRVIGITGTNGKTTTAAMLRAMLVHDGRRTGLLGTLGAWIGERHEPLDNTTPDALATQRMLARMVDDNASDAIMEVSSHGLDQHRVAGIDFAAGVFTNLTRDHLDYHGTMEAYADAKARLFDGLGVGAVAVVNAADPAAARLTRDTHARVVRYALEAPADAIARMRRMDADGAAFRLQAPELGVDVVLSTRMVGRHNVTNALAAATTALLVGVPVAAVRAGLAALSAVPGRLEPIECGQDFRVLVDYAHTPDALQQVLSMLRPLTRGRLLVVFGCGGDRDRSKRPLMGRAVAEVADALFLTSDNPRSEDPRAILDDVLAGLHADARAVTRADPDRRAAITAACAAARGGDIVLIAGKGHETTQILADRVVPFDDRQVAREVLWSL